MHNTNDQIFQNVSRSVIQGLKVEDFGALGTEVIFSNLKFREHPEKELLKSKRKLRQVR